MRTLDNYGLVKLSELNIRPGATGQLRTTCPRCSHTRKKSKDHCLSVHLDDGVFRCWNCDIEGALDTGLVKYRPAKPIQKKTDITWKRDFIINVLKNSIRDHRILKIYLNYRGCLPNKRPGDLLLHPGLEYKDGKTLVGKFPAMIGVVRSIDGKIMGVHRTYLHPQGFGKADLNPCKKAFSYKTITGGAVQLYSATDTLALTEGIETALAVHAATNLPTWATLGTSGLKSVLIPETVNRIFIMSDHDKIDPLRGYKPGEHAAKILAKRLIKHGREIKIVTPEKKGDWLDVLNEPGGNKAT